MSRSICLINGHPDRSDAHFVPALADAYARGARAAGHSVSRVDIAALDLRLLSNADEFAAPPDPAIEAVRQSIADADHLVVIYPLWMGSAPARLKSFLEQIARGGFLLDTGGDSSRWPARRMSGKSARLIVTMGMPGFAYRLIFGSHSLKALEQGVFRMSGFRPVRDTVLGAVEAVGPAGRARMLQRVERLGRAGR